MHANIPRTHSYFTIYEKTELTVLPYILVFWSQNLFASYARMLLHSDPLWKY